MTSPDRSISAPTDFESLDSSNVVRGARFRYPRLQIFDPGKYGLHSDLAQRPDDRLEFLDLLHSHGDHSYRDEISRLDFVGREAAGRDVVRLASGAYLLRRGRRTYRHRCRYR